MNGQFVRREGLIGFDVTIGMVDGKKITEEYYETSISWTEDLGCSPYRELNSKACSVKEKYWNRCRPMVRLKTTVQKEITLKIPQDFKRRTYYYMYNSR